MEKSCVNVCFRLIGENLDPDEVTRALEIEANQKHRRGEARHGPRCRKPWSEGLWLLNSPVDEAAFVEEYLLWLLERLEPKILASSLFSVGNLSQD